MFITAKFLTSKYTRDHALLTYQLIDTEYVKTFYVEYLRGLQGSEFISNQILDFIYQEYKDTKYCPFAAIKKIYDDRFFIPDNIRATPFYMKHKRTMDKILRPASIMPVDNYSISNYTTNTWSTPTSSTSTYYTFRIR